MSALQGESICILTLHMYVCMCNLFLQSLPGFVRACDPSSVGREILNWFLSNIIPAVWREGRTQSLGIFITLPPFS